MRRVVAFIFILIFSIQFLPAKAIGKSLVKGQQSEEVKDDCADEDYSDSEYIYLDSLYFSSLLETNSHPPFNFSDDESLPDNHIRDILCPPPNC